MKKLVVFTGAGISVESGLQTYQSQTIIGTTKFDWVKQRSKTLKTYNERLKCINDSKPNYAHYLLAELQQQYDVTIITQNIDDLHERAGSNNVIHLHGNITQARGLRCQTIQSQRQHFNDKCNCCNTRLRPNVVFYGETIHNYLQALAAIQNADIVVVIGSSLSTYPANQLPLRAPIASQKYYIDPQPTALPRYNNIATTATLGLTYLIHTNKLTLCSKN